MKSAYDGDRRSFTPRSRRLNILLPDSTVAVLDRVVPKGNRSRFIHRAVLQLVKNEGTANLRERLKQGAMAKCQAQPGAYRGVVSSGAGSMAATRSPRSGQATGYPRRGEIYVTAVDPALGHEIKKPAGFGDPERRVQPVWPKHNHCCDHLQGQHAALSQRGIDPAVSCLRFAVTSTVRLDQLRTVTDAGR